MDKNKHLEEIILFAGREDYAGLWEIIWETNKNNGTLKDTATIIKKLLKNNEIKLFKNIWGTPDHVLLTPEEASSVIQNETSWEPPAIHSECYKIRAS